MHETEIFLDKPFTIKNVLTLDDAEFSSLTWDGTTLYDNSTRVLTENLMHFDLNGVTYYRCIDGLLRPEHLTT